MYPEITIDPVKYAERQVAIAELMARVNAKRLLLKRQLAAGALSIPTAKLRNSSIPGVLGSLWSDFMNLPVDLQLQALESSDFQGMSWQSLLQCSPYIEKK